MPTEALSQAPPASAQETEPGPTMRGARARSYAGWGAWLADGLMIGLFLAIIFLLGVFPLKDTDFYWHLRTGDWIRQTGRIPRVDLFTFTRAGQPWIDLHWIFQVGISWLHQHGGVPALLLAKCAITCAALLLLITARRRDWPVWVSILAWLPALVVLSGRIYVRPETLTLFYLSVFLAVIMRWDRLPRLVWALPLVQALWVNSHGLFVLGPVILSFGLVDALLRFGLVDSHRRKWWRTILPGSALTALACLINPYFLTGALYPIELAGTMRNPIFSRHTAELTSIPDFIRSAGLWNVPLLFHLATIAVGALSFLVPMGWLVRTRLAARPVESIPSDARQVLQGRRSKKSRVRRDRREESPAAETSPAALRAGADWHASPFRLLLFAAFCMLSMQATRNSHQFAAVVGTVTAWNFGEWAAAIRRHRARAPVGGVAGAGGLWPRLAVLAMLAVLLTWVGSGGFFRFTGEGRTIALHEEPFFYPHEAAKLAGRPGMPDRCLAFHNGNASVYEYHNGPDKKTYTDPRLEVAGADLYKRYLELQERIGRDLPGWDAELAEMGHPVVLSDHEYNCAIGATLLRNPRWRCIWFDLIAAVFVHGSQTGAAREPTVDFAARHFRPEPRAASSETLAELTVAVVAYRKYVSALSRAPGGPTAELAWLGLDAARRILEQAPDSFEAWKNQGSIELRRSPPGPPRPRYRMVFAPAFDLSSVRATYALRRASELVPDDFMTLHELHAAFDHRLMTEPALSVLEQLLSVRPKNQLQASIQAELAAAQPEYVRKLGTPPPTTWKNLSDLDQIVTAQLAAGRIAGAAGLLEQANPPAAAPWEVVDRIATLRLHLGEPAKARSLWTAAAPAPKKGLQAARIGTTYLAEANFNQARREYQRALAENPELFEAAYCLAVLEQDQGAAAAAYDQANVALETATDDAGRSAARLILSNVSRFARPAGKAR